MLCAMSDQLRDPDLDQLVRQINRQTNSPVTEEDEPELAFEPVAVEASPRPW